MVRPTNFLLGILTISSEIPIDWKTVTNIVVEQLPLPEFKTSENTGLLEFLLSGIDDLKSLKSIAKRLRKDSSMMIKCEIIEL